MTPKRRKVVGTRSLTAFNKIVLSLECGHDVVFDVTVRKNSSHHRTYKCRRCAMKDSEQKHNWSDT